MYSYYFHNFTFHSCINSQWSISHRTKWKEGKYLSKPQGKNIKGIRAPESKEYILSLALVAAQHPFFNLIAKEANNKSKANPNDTLKSRLINANTPLMIEAGNGFIPNNGDNTHKGSP